MQVVINDQEVILAVDLILLICPTIQLRQVELANTSCHILTSIL